jgi:hypothetical protein
MRRCVVLLAAAGALVLGGALVYRAASPAPKASPPATINIKPDGTAAGPVDEAAWRYRLAQPRHWRYLLLNN